MAVGGNLVKASYIT